MYIIHFKLRTAVDLLLNGFLLCLGIKNISLPYDIYCYNMMYIVIICVYLCGQSHTVRNKFNPLVIIT